MNFEATLQERVEVLAVAADARRFGTCEGLSLRESEKLALVVAELGMNALRHGGGRGRVRVNVGASGWRVEVEDEGAGLTDAVLADAGQSDRLGAAGVREPADGRRSLGSGLASVRRLSSRLELSNRRGGGARVIASRELVEVVEFQKGAAL
jgi:anti-sigma regulatory factor (Ser/Thr protein kinase)